jgi:predicted phage terminase large subunit-like protein
MAATEEDKKKKNDPDWTAGALVAVQKAKDGAQAIYVKDVRRIRARPAGVESLIRNTAIEDGRSVPIWIEQEPGSSGVNVIDNYVRRILFGWNVRGDKVTGPKVERWRPLSSQAEAGNVHLLRGAWNSWWLEEANASPQEGVHDDGLDAVAGALDKLLFAPVEYSGGITAERRA